MAQRGPCRDGAEVSPSLEQETVLVAQGDVATHMHPHLSLIQTH